MVYFIQSSSSFLFASSSFSKNITCFILLTLMLSLLVSSTSAQYVCDHSTSSLIISQPPSAPVQTLPISVIDIDNCETVVISGITTQSYIYFTSSSGTISNVTNLTLSNIRCVGNSNGIANCISFRSVLYNISTISFSNIQLDSSFDTNDFAISPATSTSASSFAKTVINFEKSVNLVDDGIYFENIKMGKAFCRKSVLGASCAVNNVRFNQAMKRITLIEATSLHITNVDFDFGQGMGQVVNLDIYLASTSAGSVGNTDGTDNIEVKRIIFDDFRISSAVGVKSQTHVGTSLTVSNLRFGRVAQNIFDKEFSNVGPATIDRAWMIDSIASARSLLQLTNFVISDVSSNILSPSEASGLSNFVFETPMQWIGWVQVYLDSFTVESIQCQVGISNDDQQQQLLPSGTNVGNGGNSTFQVLNFFVNSSAIILLSSLSVFSEVTITNFLVQNVDVQMNYLGGSGVDLEIASIFMVRPICRYHKYLFENVTLSNLVVNSPSVCREAINVAAIRLSSFLWAYQGTVISSPFVGDAAEAYVVILGDEDVVASVIFKNIIVNKISLDLCLLESTNGLTSYSRPLNVIAAHNLRSFDRVVFENVSLTNVEKLSNNGSASLKVNVVSLEAYISTSVAGAPARSAHEAISLLSFNNLQMINISNVMTEYSASEIQFYIAIINEAIGRFQNVRFTNFIFQNFKKNSCLQNVVSVTSISLRTEVVQGLSTTGIDPTNSSAVVTTATSEFLISNITTRNLEIFANHSSDGSLGGSSEITTVIMFGLNSFRSVIFENILIDDCLLVSGVTGDAAKLLEIISTPTMLEAAKGWAIASFSTFTPLDVGGNNNTLNSIFSVTNVTISNINNNNLDQNSFYFFPSSSSSSSSTAKTKIPEFYLHHEVDCIELGSQLTGFRTVVFDQISAIGLGGGRCYSSVLLKFDNSIESLPSSSYSFGPSSLLRISNLLFSPLLISQNNNNNNNFRIDPSNDFVKVATNVRPISPHFGVQFGGFVTNYGSVAICNITFQNVVSILTSLDASAIYRLVYAERLSSEISVVTFQGPSPSPSIVTLIPSPVSSFLVENLTMCDMFVKAAITVAGSASAAGLQIFGVLLIAEIKNFYLVKFSNIYHTSRNFLFFSVEATNFLLELKDVALSEAVYCESATVNNNNNNDEGCSFVVKNLGFVGPMTLRSNSGLYAKNLQINQHLSGFRQILIDNLTIDDVYARSRNSGTSEIANFVLKDQTYFISSFIDQVPAFTPPPLTPTTTMSAPEIPTALSPPSLVSITNLHQRNVTSIHGGTKLAVGNLIIHGTIADFENILFENFTINSTSSRVFTSSTSICNNIGGRISATNLDNSMLRVGNIQFGVGNTFGPSQIVGLSDGTNLNSSFIVRNVYFDFSGGSSEPCSSSSSSSSNSLSHQIVWGSRDPNAEAVSLSAVRFMYPITQFNTYEFRSIGFLGCKKCFLNASQVSLAALYLTEVQSIITENLPLPPPSSAQQRALFLEKPPSFICENIQITNMNTEYISSIALAQFGTSILNFAKVSFINLVISDCTFVSPPPQSFIIVFGVWTRVAIQGISDGEDDTTAKTSSMLSFEHIKFSSLNVIADSPVDVYAICTSSPISNFTNIFINDVIFDHIKIESAQRVDGHIALAKLVGPISGVVPAANSKIVFDTPSSDFSFSFVVQNLHMIDVTSTIHSTTIMNVDASGEIEDFSKMEISNFSATRILVNFAGKVPSSVTDIVPQFKIYFAHFAADVTMLTLNNNNNNSVVITNLTFQDIHFEANNYVVDSSPVSFILRCVALEQSFYNVDRFSLTNVAMDNIFLVYPPDLGVTRMKMDIVVGVALSDDIPSTISSSASAQSFFEMSNLQLTNFFIDSPNHFHSWPSSSATSSSSSTQLFEGKLITTVFSSQNVNPSTAGIFGYRRIKFSNLFVQTPQRLNSINNNKNTRLLLHLNDPNIVPLYFAGSSLEGRRSSSAELSNFSLEIDNVTISDDNTTRVNILGKKKDSSVTSVNQQQQQGKSPNLVATKQGMIAAVSIDFNSGFYISGFETASFLNIHLLVKTVIVVPSQFVRITSFLLQFKMGDDVRIWNFVNNSFDFKLLPLNYETYFFVGNQSSGDFVPQLPSSPIPSKYYSFGYGRISFLLIPPQKYFSSSNPQYNSNVSVTFESNTFHFSNSLSSTSSSSSSLFPPFIISQQQRVNNDLKFGKFVGIFIFFIDVFEQDQITNQNSLLNGAWKFTRNVFDTNDVCYKKSPVASNPYFFKFTSAAVQPPIHVTSAFLGLALVTFTFPSSLTFTDNFINFETSPYSQLLLFISAASYPPSVKFLQQTNNNYGSIFSKTTNFTFDCNRWKDVYLKTFMQNFVAPATTVALKNISLNITTIFNVFQFNFTVELCNNKNFRKNCSLLSTTKSNSKSKYSPSESMSLSKPSPSLITKSASTNDLTKSKKMTQSELTETKSLLSTEGTKSGDSESKTQTASHPPPRPPLLQYSVKESSQTVGVVVSTIIPSNAGAMNIRRIMSIAKMIDCGGKANDEGGDGGGDDNDDEGIGPDVNPLMLKIPKINPLKRGTIVGALLVILIWCSFFAVIAVIKKWVLSSDEKEKRKNIHLSRPRLLIASYGRAFRKMGLPGQAFVPASSLLPASVATASTIAATFAKIHKNDSGSGEKAIDGILIFVSYLTSIVLPLLVMLWIHRQIQSHEVLLTKEIIKEDMEQDLEKRNEMKRQRRENEQNKRKGGNESFSVQNVLNVMKRSLSPSFEQQEEHFRFNADDDDDDDRHASELQQSFLMELSSERKNNTRMQTRLASTINIIPKSAHEHFDAVLQEGHREEFHERQSKKRETANITASSTSPKQVSISHLVNNHHHQTTISSSASSSPLWEKILRYFCIPRMEYRRSKFSEQYGAIFTNVNNFRYTICAYANLVAIQATSGVIDSCTSQSCCKSGLIAMLIFTIIDLVLIAAFRFPFLVRIEFICVVISCAISFLISCLSIHLYFSAAAGNNASSGKVFAVLEILGQISFYCALSGVVISLLAEVAFALSEVKMGQKILNAFGGGVSFDLGDEGDDERQNREVKVAKQKKERKIIKKNKKNSKKNDQSPHQEETIEGEENLLALKPSKKVKKEKKNHKK